LIAFSPFFSVFADAANKYRSEFVKGNITEDMSLQLGVFAFLTNLLCFQVWQLYEENHPLDMVDPKLANFNSNEVLRAIHVALLCTQGSPHQRPSMSRAVSMLAGDVEMGEVVNKPSYITEWQIKGGNTSSFMSSNVSGQSSMAPRAASSHTSSPFMSSVIEEGR
jgi:hypothetical protein